MIVSGMWLPKCRRTASLIELARGFAKAKRPERSVLFLAVTAEEKGLLGSEYYATHPLYPLEKTVAVINMDGMAPFGPSRDFGIYGAARFELLDQLKDVAKGWDIRYTPDPKPEAGLFFRSDHFPFAKRGVPALSYSAGQDWIDGGVTPARRSWPRPQPPCRQSIRASRPGPRPYRLDSRAAR